MDDACAYKFGEGNLETMKSVAAALVADFVEDEHRVDPDRLHRYGTLLRRLEA